MQWTRITRLARAAWPVLLGLGLVLVMLFGLVPRLAVEAQPVDSTRAKMAPLFGRAPTPSLAAERPAASGRDEQGALSAARLRRELGASASWARRFPPVPADLRPRTARDDEAASVRSRVSGNADQRRAWAGPPSTPPPANPTAGPEREKRAAPPIPALSGGAGSASMAAWGRIPPLPASVMPAHNYRVINALEQPELDLLMNVNYGHDWVEGAYETGHTLWITVTESQTATIKATAELTTGVIPWWGEGTGFSTNLGDPWAPSRPDMAPGDWLFGTMDNGYSGTVRMGTITGDLDVDADTISGTINASWFTETLNGWCQVWEEGGPGSGFTVDPAGGTYSCSFGLMGWDLLPGHQVGVEYQEPDGDNVINIFRIAAPDVVVEKWVEGNDQVAAGGRAVFAIRYRNQGDGEAAGVVLTDTLPANSTYVTDTSGVGANVGTGVVSWTLGALDPGEDQQFHVVLSNSADAGVLLTNHVDVYALYDVEPGNNEAEAEVHVIEGQPDLYVNKQSTPGDPVAGQTFRYEIDYGNQGPVPSGPVWLTDTLPMSTTIVSWYSENGYDLWTEMVSDSSQLVLSAASIPGNWGDRICLRLRVDGGVPEGTQLVNTVQIDSAGDSEPNNNQYTHDNTWVSQPRWNGSIWKSLDWGRLVPGGEAHYDVWLQNEGNMPTHVWVTDTLPAGTLFDSAWIQPPCCPDFPPDYQDGDTVAWDLGVLEPGERYMIGIGLRISSTVAPGTVVTNCAEIGIDGPDQNPDDDSACVSAAVAETGFNLRVEKGYWWESEGSQLRYEVLLWNVGTENLYGVRITDTYPASTMWNGDWWWDRWWGPEVFVDHNAGARQLIFSTDEIEANERVRIHFRVDLDGDVIGVPDLAFTNTLEAPVAGDVYPDDNYHQVVAYNPPARPDMQVEKWVEGNGQAAPGGRSVFAIRYRNEGSATAESIVLTDTLPANTTYVDDSSGVAATVGAGWVSWTLGPLDPNQQHQFRIVLGNTATPSDTLHNEVEVFTTGDDNFGNNQAGSDVHVIEGQPDLYVNKQSTPGDPVAGQTFRYEIDYGNQGPVPSGPVWLTDTLPMSTTIVSWYSENGYDLWTEMVSDSSQLVLSAASIPGNWGDRIYLRLRVNAEVPQGTQLTDVVEIYTEGDADPNNNQRTHDNTWVGAPRWNGRVDKELDWGQLVPGGQVLYWFDLENGGNMPAHFWLTDTLPAGTSLQDSWTWPPCCPSLPPDYVDGNIVAWDMGILEPGEFRGIGIDLLISDTIGPGSILTNCAQVGIDAPDENPDDDTACVSAAVAEPGPNLRVIKRVWWEGDHTLHYKIRLWNVGTEDVFSVQLTDTYPLSTTWNGDWKWNRWWGPEVYVNHNEPSRQLVFSTDRIDASERVEIDFRVDLDGDMIGLPDLYFTNTVEAPVAGDRYPADNYYEVVAYSGPPDLCMGRWRPTGGPLGDGGQVGALAVHPSISGTVYAAVQARGADWQMPSTVYKSADGGENWAPLYTPEHLGRIVSLALTDTLVYGGAYNRDEGTPLPVIHRSDDGGASWSTPLSMAYGTIWGFALHPTVAQRALAFGGDYPDKAALYETTDAGLSWTEIFSRTFPGSSPTVNAALIHPTAPLTWLLTHDGQVSGQYASWIYRSGNGGLTWTEAFSITDDLFSAFVTDPVTPTIIYASTWQGNFYRSTDGGLTWGAVVTDGSAGSTLVLDPPNTLYTTQGSEIRTSTDGGDHWSPTGGVPGEIRALAIDLGPTPGALYAGLQEQGVYRSSNGGVDWERRNLGIEMPVWPRDIEVDPQNPDRLFVATEGNGGWRTTNGGATWAPLGIAGWLGAFAINPENTQIVYAGEHNCGRGAVMRSADGGLTFTPVYTATFIMTDCSGGSQDLYALAIAPSVSQTVYAAGADRPDWSGPHAIVVRSPDDGLSWTEVFTLPEDSRVSALAIDPSDDQVVYAGGQDCSGASGPGCVGMIYRTVNAGASWTLVLTTTNTVRSIVVDHLHSNVLYASDDNSDVYKSTDHGDSWALVRSCCPSGSLLAVDPNTSGHIYLAGSGYIAESTDGGLTWSDWGAPINRGWPGMEPKALAVDYGTLTQTLYAGFDGVWFYRRAALPGTPSSPLPADSATAISVNVNLDWADTSGTISYDVYFGTSSPPPFVGNVASSEYDLPRLSYSTPYYWQVVAKNDCGQSAGPEWTFTTGVNTRPTLGIVDPSSGTGPTGVTTYFTTSWEDADGWEDLKQCWFHIGADPSLVANVTLMYNAAKNKLWILDDSGTMWLGGYEPGSNDVLENSQAKVYCRKTRIQGSGDTLGVRWAIEFKPGYEGTKKLGLKCKDRAKARAKAKWKGSWTVY